jgi:hypothetical protein
VKVRPRTAEDLEPCVDLLRAVHDADGYPMLWPDDPASWLSPHGLLSAWVVRREAELRGWSLWLDVVEDRGGAIEFYERNRWRLVERRRANWPGPGGRPPVVRTYVDDEQPGDPSLPS